MTDSQQRLPPRKDAESAGRRVKEINHAARLKSRMLIVSIVFFSCYLYITNPGTFNHRQHQPGKKGHCALL